MNDIQCLFNQQYGYRKWSDIDSIISRFRCLANDEYKQILPDEIDSEVDTPIFACKFAQKKGYEHILALANEDGRLAIHNVKGNDQRYGKQAHHNAIFDLAWMFQQMKLVTVSGDHTAKLFNITNTDIQEEQIFNGHSRSVKTVAFSQVDSSVFATGGRDGSIIVWDTRAALCSNYLSLPDRTICNSHYMSKVTTPTHKLKKKYCNNPISGANSVTGLVFQDEYTLISCGAGDGVIKAWDLRKNYRAYKRDPLPKHILPYAGTSTRNGFSNIIMDSNGMKLYANCLDNTIYCYNIVTYNTKPVMKFTGHQNSTFYVKSGLNYNGQYLISGSSDQNAYIWNTNDTIPCVKLTGHSAEVTCVAWCQSDYSTLITCSDDMKHKIWHIGTEELPDNWEVIGCGVAEKIIKTEKKKLKRSVAMFDAPNFYKKHKRLCEKCNCATPNSKVCENCTPVNNKRKINDNLLSNDNKKPKSLFTPVNLNIPSTSSDYEPVTKMCKNFNEDLLSDLPNFVVDGNAPHLNYSPQKYKEMDWLTKMRVEKSIVREMYNLTNPTPPKVPKLDLSNQSKTKKSVKKMNKCESQQSPILKFFKVTNSSSTSKCDNQHCSSRSPNCTNISQQPTKYF